MTDNPQSNAQIIAELQAIALATRLFGLNALPQVMNPALAPKED